MSLSKAKVVSVKYLTPTIRWFLLQSLESNPVRFYAGQWLDLYIPTSKGEIITGYSMCSSTSEFLKSRRFELAVKQSEEAASLWMHNECSVGMELSYKFGGEVYIDEKDIADNKQGDYLLIAGGVGINPMYSILQSLVAVSDNNMYMLYSAKTSSELMFSDDINRLSREHSNLHAQYFVTKGKPDVCNCSPSTQAITFGRRLSRLDLQPILDSVNKDKVCVYICGPNSMMTSLSDDLKELGVAPHNIHHETWW